MLGNTRLLAICASVALVLGAGCGSDGPTLVGLEPRLDQKGLGAGGRPEIFRFTDAFDVVVPDECPFAIQVVGQDRIIVQVFETHVVIHHNYKAIITNLATGFAYTDRSAWMDILHLNDLGDIETVTVIGGIFHITLPGQGIVSHDTGIITYNPFTGEVLFEGGPHENFHGTAPGTCDLLSGGDV